MALEKGVGGRVYDGHGKGGLEGGKDVDGVTVRVQVKLGLESKFNEIKMCEAITWDQSEISVQYKLFNVKIYLYQKDYSFKRRVRISKQEDIYPGNDSEEEKTRHPAQSSQVRAMVTDISSINATTPMFVPRYFSGGALVNWRRAPWVRISITMVKLGRRVVTGLDRKITPIQIITGPDHGTKRAILHLDQGNYLFTRYWQRYEHSANQTSNHRNRNHRPRSLSQP